MFASEKQARLLEQQKFQVAQLRREASIHRIKVSKAIGDIKKYIMENQAADHLLLGFANDKQNPYREKSSCSLI